MYYSLASLFSLSLSLSLSLRICLSVCLSVWHCLNPAGRRLYTGRPLILHNSHFSLLKLLLVVLSVCIKVNRAEDVDLDTMVVDFGIALDIVRNCSIVVGMHPDQAAEHIVDFALAMGKPFAVIPCCVYSGKALHVLLDPDIPEKLFQF